MTDYTVSFEWNIEADTPEDAAQLTATLIAERVAEKATLTFKVKAPGTMRFVDVE